MLTKTGDRSQKSIAKLIYKQITRIWNLTRYIIQIQNSAQVNSTQ